MEFRVLQYFLAAAREGSLSGAAEVLHLSQPTLSRQLKDLEEELGKRLFIRNSRGIALTEEGMLLRKRAEEIDELLQRTRREIALPNKEMSGDVYIGAAEAEAARVLIQAARAVQQEYPLIRFHISSGDISVLEELEKGLVDFALVNTEVDPSRYACRAVPYRNTWGILMPRNAPLSARERLTMRDLQGLPLILSRQVAQTPQAQAVFYGENSPYRVVATYNLLYNGALMVEEGMGYALGLDKIIHVSGDSALCFRPLEPLTQTQMVVVWKRNQRFSKAAQVFLDQMRALDLDGMEQGPDL